jgi:hypothetical protein
MDWGKIIQAIVKAIIGEIKTPVGWMNLICVAVAFYLLHRRDAQYEEMLKGLLAQGMGYAAAVEKAKSLLGYRLPDEALLGVILFTLLLSLILAYRAYVRLLSKQSSLPPPGKPQASTPAPTP